MEDRMWASPTANIHPFVRIVGVRAIYVEFSRLQPTRATKLADAHRQFSNLKAYRISCITALTIYLS